MSGFLEYAKANQHSGNCTRAEAFTMGQRSRQSEIDQLKAEKAGVVGLLSKWKKDSEYADSVASEDFVQNVLDGCIDELGKTLRGNS